MARTTAGMNDGVDPVEDGPGDVGGYPQVPGVAWVPMYGEKASRSHDANWRRLGYLSAGVVAVLALVALWRMDGDPAGQFGVVAIAGAVAGGLLLLGAGIGMLSGEALRAQAVPPNPTRRADRDLLGGDIAAVATGLKEGLSGLTAARSLVFAGAFLLSVSAIAGAISIRGAA
ncbi:MAG: hypothetical protein IPO93_17405 [Actinobacteria bacterium]|jgi:hypothetical protein|nr:hypothetical protein [Actinomycetota bacterium]